jgi:Tfp pilus assembly protein PilO
MSITGKYHLKRLQKRVPYWLFSTFKYRFLLSFSSFIIVVIVVFLIVIRPKQQHLAQLQFKAESGLQQLQRKQHTQRVSIKQLDLHQKLKEMLTPFYSVKPDYLVATSLVNELEIWSERNNIVLRKVTWGELIESENITIQPVSLDLSGRYSEIIHLFQFISTHYGYLDIVKFEIQQNRILQVTNVNAADMKIPPPQGTRLSTPLSLTLELHVYMLKS